MSLIGLASAAGQKAGPYGPSANFALANAGLAFGKGAQSANDAVYNNDVQNVQRSNQQAISVYGQSSKNYQTNFNEQVALGKLGQGDDKLDQNATRIAQNQQKINATIAALQKKGSGAGVSMVDIQAANASINLLNDLKTQGPDMQQKTLAPP